VTTVQELIDRLLKYFNAEKVNVEVIESVRSYLQKLNLGSVELVLIYEAIKEHHESMSFPKVFQVRKIWNEHGVRYNSTKSSKDVNNAKETYRHTGHEAVINELRNIRVKQNREETISNKEIDLLDTYDDLYYIHTQIYSLPSGVMDIVSKETYLRKAKESIDNGIAINFTAFEKAMARRRAMAEEGYGEQERERAEKLSKSAADIENAFGARSQALEPEKDRVFR